MMQCFMCKGSIEDKTTVFMVEMDKCIIIIKNVPSQVCRQCGAVSYADTVSAHIEELVKSVKYTMTEIAVIDYDGSNRAA